VVAREEARAALRRCPDLERALSRLAVGRGGPRDLLAVAQALERAAALAPPSPPSPPSPTSPPASPHLRTWANA
jgi:DNA mismatch repair protein MutS